MPAIEEGYKTNFETLMRAAKEGRMILADCRDKKTGKPVRVIAAVSDSGTGEFDIIPFARMFDGNPFEELDPPGYDDSPATTNKK
jgi:hypothetical protein